MIGAGLRRRGARGSAPGEKARAALPQPTPHAGAGARGVRDEGASWLIARCAVPSRGAGGVSDFDSGPDARNEHEARGHVDGEGQHRRRVGQPRGPTLPRVISIS